MERYISLFHKFHLYIFQKDHCDLDMCFENFPNILFTLVSLFRAYLCVLILELPFLGVSWFLLEVFYTHLTLLLFGLFYYHSHLLFLNFNFNQYYHLLHLIFSKLLLLTFSHHCHHHRHIARQQRHPLYPLD